MADIVLNHDAWETPHRDQVYNGLDTCLTAGVYEALKDTLNPKTTGLTYAMEMGLQAPAMAMQLRGVAIDAKARNHALYVLRKGQRRAKRVLQRLSKKAGYRDDFNPSSHIQVKKLLYDILGAKRQYAKGPAKKLTADVNALLKLRKLYRANTLINKTARGIMLYRNCEKQAGAVASKLSPDGRMHSSWNVGATETGRWSSSSDCFYNGTNCQNWTKRRRNIFVPDPGYLFGNVDLSQAESMVVAFLSGDEAYIAAHLDPEVDTHVAVAKMIWPELDWTGDPEADLKLAKQPNFYRHFSRRDLAKRIQHGSNYGGTHYTVAATLGIPRADALELQERYFSAFPGIRNWHKEQKVALRRYGMLFTPLMRRRQFFGHVFDPATVREAVAHIPQSMVGDINAIGIWNIWKKLDNGDPSKPGTGDLEILMNGHDACLFQFRADRLDLAYAARDCMVMEVEVNGKIMCIPADLEIGYNWRDLKSPEDFYNAS